MRQLFKGSFPRPADHRLQALTRLERDVVARFTAAFFGPLRAFVRDFAADFFGVLAVAFFPRAVGFATAFFCRFADGLDRDFFATLDRDFFDARFLTVLVRDTSRT